jgi:TM2 domain-containing membrane protein YozV
VVWVIVDAFLLAGYVTTFNLQLRAALLSRYGVLQADQISNYVSANVQKATSDFSLQSREVGTAYLLMLAGGVGGLFGAHRFYLGHRGVGAAQAILTISVVGLIVSVPWVIVDAFLVAGLVVGYNDNVKRHVAMENGIPVTA